MPSSIRETYSFSVKGYISIDIESKYFFNILIASFIYDKGLYLLESPVNISMCLRPVEAIYFASFSISLELSFFRSCLLSTLKPQ